ncbi:17083_t:CDS:2, partial [Cetraspora pellucida]
MRAKEANDVITKQLQKEAIVRTSRLELFWLSTVSIDNNTSINNSDSDSESSFEVETDNIISFEKLNNTIKHLKKEIK